MVQADFSLCAASVKKEDMPAKSNIGDEYPIETVNWFEAAYFANALSLREVYSQCNTLTGCSPIPGNDMECTGVSTTPTVNR